MTPTEAIVACAWEAELRLPRVGLDEDFIDLGSHSLQGLAIAARLEQEFGIAIPVRALFEEPTVADLAAWIDARRATAQQPLADIVRLQGNEASQRRPMFALPGGRGDAQQLYALAKLGRTIDPSWPMYAFPGDPPVPDSVPDGEWVSAAAAAVVARMRGVQPAGPYLLLGVCAGGVIAWEAARQIETAGEIAHLLLVDTRNPQSVVGAGTFRHAVTGSLTAEERRSRHRRRREWRRDAITGEASGQTSEEMDEGAARRVWKTRAYHPRPLRGRVALLVNEDWHQVASALGWEGLAEGGIDVEVTERGHILDWHIPEVAMRLRSWLAGIERERDDGLPAGAREPRGTSTLTPPATVLDAIARWALQTPEAPAIFGVDGEALDYHSLQDAIVRLAGELRGLGIGRDDLLLIALPDGPAKAVTILAAMTAGIAAPLSAELTRHEFAASMADGLARAVIVPSGAATPALDAAHAAMFPVFVLSAATRLETGYRIDGVPVGPAAAAQPPRLEEIALVIASSGTTGKPKRIPRTHGNIAVTSADVTRVFGMSPQERCLNLAPMAFSQGMNALLNTLWAGGSLLALPGFDLARLPERIAAWRPTWFSATPTVLRAIAMDTASSAAVRADPPRVIRASAGGISAAEIAFLEEQLGAPVLHSYGMSEASFISGEASDSARRKPGSAGNVNHEVRIIGEDGRPLPSGETGEIVTHGPNLFPGYLNDPEANAAVFLPDGWFRTGDLGRVDEDGFLYVTGRLKDVIKRGGMAISPFEIEEVLLADPAVAEACVFGVPHWELGEDVAAAVVLRPGALATERGLRGRVAAALSAAKTPRHIVFLTEIAKTATGKPLRGELAVAVAALLAAETEEREVPAGDDGSDALTARIATIWARILQDQQVTADDDLFDLGVDSLQIARLHVEMEQQFGITLPAGLLFAEPTPARAAAWVAARMRGAVPSAPQGVEKRPIFFVTAASSGKHPLRPARLGELIDPERPVHDLAVPVRLIAPISDNGEELARVVQSCLAAARAEQRQGPYLLAGIAAGGSVAVEMARQWEVAGETVHLLLLDSRSPTEPADVGTPFAGSVTVIATREALAEAAGLNWASVISDRVRIIPIARHERPRRMQAEAAAAVKSWLEECERA